MWLWTCVHLDNLYCFLWKQIVGIWISALRNAQPFPDPLRDRQIHERCISCIVTKIPAEVIKQWCWQSHQCVQQRSKIKYSALSPWLSTQTMVKSCKNIYRYMQKVNMRCIIVKNECLSVIHLSWVCTLPDRVAGQWYSQGIQTCKQAFIHHPWLQLSEELLGRYLMTASQATLEKGSKRRWHWWLMM